MSNPIGASLDCSSGDEVDVAPDQSGQLLGHGNMVKETPVCLGTEAHEKNSAMSTAPAIATP
jgi:hypothetical protein